MFGRLVLADWLVFSKVSRDFWNINISNSKNEKNAFTYLFGVWNTIFWQILMIFLLLDVDFIAWFDHPGLWNIGHLWPLFFAKWRIFWGERSQKNSSDNANLLWQLASCCYFTHMRQLAGCYLVFWHGCDNSPAAIYLTRARATTYR